MRQLWSRYRPALLLLAALSIGIGLMALFGKTGAERSPDGLIADFSFADGEGNAVRLADFRGRTILLNVWATWCLPCREEMPMLDRLQEELAAPGFEVIAISIDRTGVAAVQRFYEEYGISNLGIYLDANGASRTPLALFGMPTTLLIDQNGHELFRVVGATDWNSREMIARIRENLSGSTASVALLP